MTMPNFTMRQLLEAGVHFGHHMRRWNPRMKPYLFGIRSNIHIIDLQQSLPLLHRALEAMRDVAARGGRILFVGTKRQASPVIADAARRCGQHFVNHRWLGGMLTNWNTVSRSIKRLKQLDEMFAREEGGGFTKKERLSLERERDKLDRALGGIKDMGDVPDMLFVIDTVRESIAVAEAEKLGIPVAAILDSNSNPGGIRYPVPGNDDALRAITLYCNLAAEAILDGIRTEMAKSDPDSAAAVDPLAEMIPDSTAGPAIGEESPQPEAIPEAETTPEPVRSVDSGESSPDEQSTSPENEAEGNTQENTSEVKEEKG